MDWDVVEVKPKKHLVLSVRFHDGTKGRVFFKKTHLRGVFKALKNANFFNKVFLDHGAVTWPGELDLAPDAMYEAIQKDGEWILQ